MNISRRSLLGRGPASLLALSLVSPLSHAFAAGGEALRIGALNPVTGAGSPYGSGMQKAIIMAASEVNAAGGVAGNKVEVFAEDSETSPQAGVLAAKKLIEVNKVHAILGTWSSGVVAAVMPLTDAAGIPHLTNAGASNIVSHKGLMFRFSALSRRMGEALGRMVAKRGVTRVATMAIDNPSGLDIVHGFKAAWDKAGGQAIAEIVYQPKQPTYRSEVQKVVAADPQAVVIGGYLPDFTVILRETRQAGSRVSFFVPAWAINQKLIDSLGAEATEGILTYDYVAALDGPAYQSFAARFKRAAGGDPADNYYACCAYDMMMVTALAAEAAAGKDSLARNIRAVAGPPGSKVHGFAEGRTLLRHGTKIDYDGASGPIDFDAAGNVRPLFRLSEVRGGKLVVIGRVFQDY